MHSSKRLLVSATGILLSASPAVAITQSHGSHAASSRTNAKTDAAAARKQAASRPVTTARKSGASAKNGASGAAASGSATAAPGVRTITVPPVPAPPPIPVRTTAATVATAAPAPRPTLPPPARTATQRSTSATTRAPRLDADDDQGDQNDEVGDDCESDDDNAACTTSTTAAPGSTTTTVPKTTTTTAAPTTTTTAAPPATTTTTTTAPPPPAATVALALNFATPGMQSIDFADGARGFVASATVNNPTTASKAMTVVITAHADSGWPGFFEAKDWGVVNVFGTCKTATGKDVYDGGPVKPSTSVVDAKFTCTGMVPAGASAVITISAGSKISTAAVGKAWKIAADIGTSAPAVLTGAF